MHGFQIPEALNDRLRSWSGLPQMVAHQIGWWACVLWMGWTGPAAMVVFLLLHLGLTRSQWRPEVALIAASTVIGIAVDNTLFTLGAVSYKGTLLVGFTPLWLVSIWAGFGATLRHCQAVFVQSPKVALLTGCLGGPAAYWGGERLDRMLIGDPWGWIAVSVTWTAALLALQWLSAVLRKGQ
jgi:hypothetical protein